MFDPVPWFVGGGATHSPEVARLLAYAATGGAEGVIEGADLKVVPLATPGGAVRILPGACVIRARSAAGARQSYIARAPSETRLDITPTTSGAGRSDLIVARIEDPNVAGENYPAPTDPAAGPYVFPRVIPNVPAGTTRLQDVSGYGGSSAVTLARVDLPASTGTITSGTIVDLRKLAQNRSARSLSVDIAVPQVAKFESFADTQWPTNTAAVDVPEWATHFTGIVQLNQFLQTGGSEYVAFRIKLGTITSATTNADIDSLQTAAQHGSVTIAIGDAIPAAMRGTRQTVSVIAKRMSSSEPGRFSLDSSSQIVFDMQFREQVS